MKFIKILVFKVLFVQMPRSKRQPVLQLTQIAPPKAMFQQMQTPLRLQSITLGLNAQQHRHASGHTFEIMVPVNGVAQQSAHHQFIQTELACSPRQTAGWKKCLVGGQSPTRIKRYTAKLEYDDRDSIFVGRVLGLRSILSFEGNSVELLKTAFEDAINDYLKECQDNGQNPEKPASGKLLLRLAPELHGQAMVAAKAADKSLNQWVAEVLHQAVRS